MEKNCHLNNPAKRQSGLKRVVTIWPVLNVLCSSWYGNPCFESLLVTIWWFTCKMNRHGCGCFTILFKVHNGILSGFVAIAAWRDYHSLAVCKRL